MKQIVIFFALVLGLAASAQEPGDYHFVIDETAGSVIWQRVYDGECDVDEIVQALLAGSASNVNSFDDAVTCDYHFETLDYKPLGYSWGVTSRPIGMTSR